MPAATSPIETAGAGMTILKNAATGRNTPHMFGGGLMEMIGLQMRASKPSPSPTPTTTAGSARTKPRGSSLIYPKEEVTASVLLDFYAFDDENGDGYPDLNQVFWPIFVDKNGQRIASGEQPQLAWRGRLSLRVQVYGLHAVHAVPSRDLDDVACLR